MDTMAFNRILDFSNGLDFYLGFFFSLKSHPIISPPSPNHFTRSQPSKFTAFTPSISRCSRHSIHRPHPINAIFSQPGAARAIPEQRRNIKIKITTSVSKSCFFPIFLAHHRYDYEKYPDWDSTPCPILRLVPK